MLDDAESNGLNANYLRKSVIALSYAVWEDQYRSRGVPGAARSLDGADDRDLITRAAETLGKNRSEFILDAARKAARDALLDRTLFRLDSDRFDAFVALLDAPAAPNEKMKRLLATPAPWER